MSIASFRVGPSQRMRSAEASVVQFVERWVERTHQRGDTSRPKSSGACWSMTRRRWRNPSEVGHWRDRVDRSWCATSGQRAFVNSSAHVGSTWKEAQSMVLLPLDATASCTLILDNDITNNIAYRFGSRHVSLSRLCQFWTPI